MHDPITLSAWVLDNKQSHLTTPIQLPTQNTVGNNYYRTAVYGHDGIG